MAKKSRRIVSKKYQIPLLAFFVITLAVLVLKVGSPNLFSSSAWWNPRERFSRSYFSNRRESVDRALPTASANPTASTNPTVISSPTVNPTTQPVQNTLPVSFGFSRYNDSFNVDGWGRFSSTIYYPENSSYKPYPLVILSPGFMANKDMYTWFGSQIANSGYVVLIFSPPNTFSPNNDQRIGGFREGINYISSKNADPSSPFYNLVDMNKIVTAGHSAGAMANFVATTRDSRIKGAVFFSPICRAQDLESSAVGKNLQNITDSTSFAGVVDSAQKIRVSVQMFAGSKDTIAPPSAALYCYSLINGTAKEYIEIKGGDHVGFISEQYANLAEKLGLLINIPSTQIRTGDISATEQQRITTLYLISWLNYYLKGNTPSFDQIYGAAASAGLTNGNLSNFLFSK